MARILVIEDERDLQDVLDYNLRQAGHEPVAALRGQEGLQRARASRPDLVLLDLMLPDLSGTEVCRALKKDPETARIPVLMLTAKGEEIDRVVGFELGAEDYVVKPFSVRELMLRIDVILRRAGSPEPGQQAAVEFGELRMDLGAHRVWVAGTQVELTALEFKLLRLLYERRNRVQTREVLLDDVWGIEAAITTRTVDTHIKRLREKLGAAGRYVQTVRGVGYRFADRPQGEDE
ncbi:MAG TPA: winged helix-turn-helix domain-containing protein [Myxococcales bacterium]|jgi:two-component system phosphate regulon response regulator PhoB